MSRIYFRSPTATAEVYGTERHYMGKVINDAALERFDFARHATALAPLLPPDRQPPDAGLYSEALSRWSGNLRLSLSVGFREPFTWRGGRIESFALLLNTAMTAGGNSMRLTARLHAQCEMHAWVDGPNWAWLADLIDEALRDGTFRTGWDGVLTLLRARDDEPVVTSYSVTEGFPNAGIAGWSPPPMPDGWRPSWADTPKGLAEWERDYPTDGDREERYEDDASDLWYELPDEEQWRLAMDGLRANTGRLEMRPDDWDTFYFRHGLTLADLVADDRDERLDAAFGLERAS